MRRRGEFSLGTPHISLVCVLVRESKQYLMRPIPATSGMGSVQAEV